MSLFRVIDHQFPCQHVREYPRATSTCQEDVLYLAVKQYVPLSNPKPKPGDVTIIAASANGFPKELYEPMWDDLLARITNNPYGWQIRSIWIADVAQQGESGLLNGPVLGNDPNWHDHARDLLHMMNLQRDEMPRPIVGIGHSMGGNQITRLSLIHPRLFTTVILLDAVVQPRSSEAGIPADHSPPNAVQLSTYRRTHWPSREAAAASFKKSAFYRSWDPRALDKWVKYGLRDAESPQVTLKTPVAHEVFSFLRPNFEGFGEDGKEVDRRTHADIDTIQGLNYPFYRAEPPYVFQRLPELRPSALYVFGESSDLAPAHMNEEKVRRTGRGPGGSGGLQEGKVKAITLTGVGHELPLQKPERTAETIAEWIATEMVDFRREQRDWEQNWKLMPLQKKISIDDQWQKMIGGPPKKAKI